MSHEFAGNAIALLIDLAQRGEIDPWDVNVVTVFDRFLSDLPLTNTQDLATSGQAFLYASMLVLLKAESLSGLEPDDELEDCPEDFEAEPLLERELPLNLEQHIHRRPVAQPYRKRRVTLNELIQQLELIAVAVERQSRNPRTRKKVVRPSRAQSLKTIAQLSHPENLSEVAAELERLLSEGTISESWTEFEALLSLMNDRVGLFWALLLLSAQHKVELTQNEFYQDLQLRPIPAAKRAELMLPNLSSAAS